VSLKVIRFSLKRKFLDKEMIPMFIGEKKIDGQMFYIENETEMNIGNVNLSSEKYRHSIWIGYKEHEKNPENYVWMLRKYNGKKENVVLRNRIFCDGSHKRRKIS